MDKKYQVLAETNFLLARKRGKYLVTLKSVNGFLIDFPPLNENRIEEYPFEESFFMFTWSCQCFCADQLFAATFDFLWLQSGVSSIGKLEESYIIAGVIALIIKMANAIWMKGLAIVLFGRQAFCTYSLKDMCVWVAYTSVGTYWLHDLIHLLNSSKFSTRSGIQIHPAYM